MFQQRRLLWVLQALEAPMLLCLTVRYAMPTCETTGCFQVHIHEHLFHRHVSPYAIQILVRLSQCEVPTPGEAVVFDLWRDVC